MNRTELLQLHDDTCKAARSIMEMKNNDYAGGKGSEDPFANFKMASMIGIHPAVGLLLRMMDKVQRIRTFTLDGGLAVKGESVDDACDDIVNYAILCKGLLREEREAQVNPAYTDAPKEEIRGTFVGGEYKAWSEHGVPEGLHPLPPVPEGYHRWVYRGKGWTNDDQPARYIRTNSSGTPWIDCMSERIPSGFRTMHYVEAIKDPE